MGEGRSVTIDMAHRFGMEPGNFERVLRATVVPRDCSPEQFAAFLLVAKQYNLNPITKEIYAFPARGGGIQPIVGIDGWMRIINDHPQMNGMEFRDRMDDGSETPGAITCLIYRKDREHPTVVTEYLSECKRDTDPWNKWPGRMLRHKAAIQAARYAFGFSGIIDPDEYERGVGSTVARDIKPPMPPVYKNANPDEPDTSDIPEVGEDFFKNARLVQPTNKETLQDSLRLTEEEEALIEDKVPAPLDPDKYLDDLDSVMATAKTDANLDEIWAEHMAVAFHHLMEPDQDKAQFIFDRHDARIKASAAVDAAAEKRDTKKKK